MKKETEKTTPIAPGITEGTYDAQLNLPGDFATFPPRIARIIKKDGREVPFDKNKITTAILRAAQSIEEFEPDRAESLAKAVEIYLAKTFRGTTPTVQHVRDAVEFVLRDLGHDNIAEAYARFPQKKYPIHPWNPENIFRIPDHANTLSTVFSQVAPQQPLNLILNEKFNLSPTITNTLLSICNEIGLPEELAQRITNEVKNQIISAKLNKISPLLLYELVRLKLQEWEYADLSESLSLIFFPLEQVKKSIVFPNQTESRPGYNPELSSFRLAQLIKSEFALRHLFPHQVTEAHLYGDIHIHHIHSIDHLQHFEIYLTDFLKNTPSKPGVWEFRDIPHTPDDFLARISFLADIFHSFATSEITWVDLVAQASSFAEKLNNKNRREFARLLLSSTLVSQKTFTTPNVYFPIPASPSTAQLCFTDHESEHSIELITSHQQFALHLIEISLQEASDRKEFANWIPRILLHKDELHHHHSKELAHIIIQSIAQLPHLKKRRKNLQLEIEYIDRTKHPLQPEKKRVILNPCLTEVTINLPRIAFRYQNEEEFLTEFRRLIQLVALLHQAKTSFFQNLLAARSLGPLYFLTHQVGETTVFSLDDVTACINIMGIEETLKIWTKTSLWENSLIFDKACQLIELLQNTCAHEATQFGMKLYLSYCSEPDIARRFASIDLHRFPNECCKIALRDPITNEVSYIPSMNQTLANLPPFEQIRLQSVLFKALDSPPVIPVALETSSLSPSTLLDFLKKVYNDTPAQRIRLIFS